MHDLISNQFNRIITQYYRRRLVSAEREFRAYQAPWWMDIHWEGLRLRNCYWRAVFWGLPESVLFYERVKVHGPAKISIGQSSKITSDVILDGRGGLTIGRETQVGFRSVV